MRLLRRVFLVSVILLGLAFQFNNCGEVQPSTPVDVDSNPQSCEALGTCPYQQLEIIPVRTTELVASTDLSLEFGGTCNLSTYPVGALGWKLFNSSGALLAACTQFDGACGTCQGGNFSFAGTTAIVFPYPVISPWRLEIEIQGFVPAEALSYSGISGKSKKTITIMTP